MKTLCLPSHSPKRIGTEKGWAGHPTSSVHVAGFGQTGGCFASLKICANETCSVEVPVGNSSRKGRFVELAVGNSNRKGRSVELAVGH